MSVAETLSNALANALLGADSLPYAHYNIDNNYDLENSYFSKMPFSGIMMYGDLT